MARKKLAKFDPENGHLIEECELTPEELTRLFDAVVQGGGMYTRRNEPDGVLTGEVFSRENDTVPAYNYKITFIEE